MQGLYADNATFSDEVFANLNAKEVRAMWEMLIRRGRDMKLEFSNVQETATGGSAEWTATYTFSATGKFVENKIKADFIIENGRIVKHTDHFDFKRWAGQALGFKGKVLGGTTMLRNRVQGNARAGLEKFIKQKGLN